MQDLESLKSMKQLGFVCFGQMFFEWFRTVLVFPIIMPLSWAFPVFLWGLDVRLVNSISGHAYPVHKSVWYVKFEWIKKQLRTTTNWSTFCQWKDLKCMWFSTTGHYFIIKRIYMILWIWILPKTIYCNIDV